MWQYSFHFEYHITLIFISPEEMKYFINEFSNHCQIPSETSGIVAQTGKWISIWISSNFKLSSWPKILKLSYNFLFSADQRGSFPGPRQDQDDRVDVHGGRRPHPRIQNSWRQRRRGTQCRPLRSTGDCLYNDRSFHTTVNFLFLHKNVLFFDRLWTYMSIRILKLKSNFSFQFNVCT